MGYFKVLKEIRGEIGGYLLQWALSKLQEENQVPK